MTATDHACCPTSLDALIEEETEAFVARQPQSRAFRDRARRPGRRSHVQLADRRAAGRVDQPRQRLEDLRRRRQRVLRLPRRVRRVPGRARTPRDRRGGPGPGHPRHPLRAADRGRHRRGREPGRAVRPAAVAVRQLRHRGDDGRRPPDAGRHRPRPDHQGRGLLPRPPRLGRRSRSCPRPTTTSGRPTGRTASPATAASRHAIMDLVSIVPFNDLAAVERVLVEHPGEVAGMILEPIMMNAGIIHPVDGLPRRAQGPAAPARRAAHLRRGEDRAHRRSRRRHPAGRRHPRPGLPGQGDGRRHLDRGDRRQPRR